jgi:hypothetical protein
MDHLDEFFELAAAGHLLAPLFLALGLATSGGWCSSGWRDQTTSYWISTMRFILGLIGLGGDSYLVASPLALPSSSQAGIGSVESGLAVVSWAFLLCGSVWAASKRTQAKRAVLLWCGVELVCRGPLCVLLIVGIYQQPQSSEARCYVLLMPMIAKILMALSAAIFRETDESGEDSHTRECMEDQQGKVTDENLHELSNPLSQLLL